VNVLRYHEARSTLVFCATRDAVRRLHGRLLERGFAAVALSGELSQTERSHALQSLRDGRARVCIATDVAARGLDLPDLDLVVHADLPTNRASLLHRSGRTGRAGRKGICLLMVPFTKRRRAEMLMSSASIEAAWESAPTAEAIRARDQERMLLDPALTEPSQEEDRTLARALLANRSAEDIATALIRLYRSRLPAPEELFDSHAQSHAQSHPQRKVADAPRREPRPAPDQRRETSSRKRQPSSDMVWFRATVGRRNNADPKWLVPLICRLGDVTKQEIGAIRIFDRETKFEITAEAAPGFTQSLKGAGDNEVRIEPSAGPGPVRAHLVKRRGNAG
jgi:ATP-dependent RNA helicase DeaD